MTDKPAERWFDEVYSDSFFGWGHQDKVEFAAWCNEWCRENGMESNIGPSMVQHEWAESDDPRWETFTMTKERQADAEGYSGRPITVVRP